MPLYLGSYFQDHLTNSSKSGQIKLAFLLEKGVVKISSKMWVSHFFISVTYGPISSKSCMKVGLWKLTTEKILWSSYLDYGCPDNEKTFSQLTYLSDDAHKARRYCMFTTEYECSSKLNFLTNCQVRRAPHCKHFGLIKVNRS